MIGGESTGGGVRGVYEQLHLCVCEEHWQQHTLDDNKWTPGYSEYYWLLFTLSEAEVEEEVPRSLTWVKVLQCSNTLEVLH